MAPDLPTGTFASGPPEPQALPFFLSPPPPTPPLPAGHPLLQPLPPPPGPIIFRLHPAFIAEMDYRRIQSLARFLKDEGAVPPPEEDKKREQVIRKLKKIVTDWAKVVAYEQGVPPRRATATVLTYGSYTLGVNEEASDKVLEVEPKYSEIRRPTYLRRSDDYEDEQGEYAVRKYCLESSPICSTKKNYGQLGINTHRSLRHGGQRKPISVDKMYSSKPCSTTLSGHQHRIHAIDPEEADNEKCRQNENNNSTYSTKRRKSEHQDSSLFCFQKFVHAILRSLAAEPETELNKALLRIFEGEAADAPRTPATMSFLPGSDAEKGEARKETMELFPQNAGKGASTAQSSALLPSSATATVTDSIKVSAVPAPAASALPVAQVNTHKHVHPSAADLPQARKASLHRFLEKRKDRLTAKAPYQGSPSDATPVKKELPESQPWLGLGPQVAGPDLSLRQECSQ